MKRHRLQNHVVESAFTLPACVAFAALAWWWPQEKFSITALIGLLLCLCTAYAIWLTGNANALVRIRTHLAPALWLLCTACTSYLHFAEFPAIAALCLAVSYGQLFETYQCPEGVVETFHAYLFLALGSLAYPPLLLVALPYVVYQSVYMRSINVRMLMAALLALLLPYWLWMCWCVWQQDFELFCTHLRSVVVFRLPTLEAYRSVPLPVLASLAFTSLLALAGIVHYLRNRYDDKIRVRMILYIHVCQTLLFGLAMLLLPDDIFCLLPLFVLSAVPLITHYFAHTYSRMSNLFFILSVLLLIAVAIINLWMP